MKFTQFVSTFAALGLAAVVTAGSMYMSVSGSIQQDSEEIAPVAEVDAEGRLASEIAAEVAEAMNEPLAPEKLISNRSHDIVLGTEGNFSGRLTALARQDGSVPASGMTVKVVQGGVVAGEVKTNSEGVFSFKGLKPGVAAVLGYGDDSFLLYGIRLVASDEKIAANVVTDIDSAAVSGIDVGLVRSLISEKMTNGDVRFNSEPVENDDSFPFGVGDVATSFASHRVQLQEDGSLKGLVNLLDDRTGRVREVLDLTVYMIKNGKMVGQADVENNGQFLVPDLSPGIYSIVGVGKDGTFAFGVEALAADFDAAADASSNGHYRTVAVMAFLELSVAPAGAENFNRSNASGLTDGTVGQSGAGPAPVAGTTPPGPAGGAGGGATGGGGAGAGGGGGGLGALLGAAAAGGIGYAVGQENVPASN